MRVLHCRAHRYFSKAPSFFSFARSACTELRTTSARLSAQTPVVFSFSGLFPNHQPKGKPLRPSLLWMDMRSADCARQVLATGDPALRVNSAGAGPVSAEWMIPKVLRSRRQNQLNVFGWGNDRTFGCKSKVLSTRWCCKGTFE